MLAVAISSFFGCGNKDNAEARNLAAQTAQTEQIAKQKLEEELRQKNLETECLSGLDAAKRQYQTLINDKPWDAARELRTCGQLLKDPELLALVKYAEIQAYEIQINDKKSNTETRLMSITLLSNDHPDSASKFVSLKQKLESQLALENKNEVARNEKLSQLAAKREAAKVKSEGVSIGMSQEEVRASSWGRPQSVNKTTGVYGVHEQWVYGGRNYLYFENGRLTTIQN